jgi:hypothetical protein
VLPITISVWTRVNVHEPSNKWFLTIQLDKLTTSRFDNNLVLGAGCTTRGSKGRVRLCDVVLPPCMTVLNYTHGLSLKPNACVSHRPSLVAALQQHHGSMFAISTYT